MNTTHRTATNTCCVKHHESEGSFDGAPMHQLNATTRTPGKVGSHPLGQLRVRFRQLHGSQLGTAQQVIPAGAANQCVARLCNGSETAGKGVAAHAYGSCTHHEQLRIAGGLPTQRSTRSTT
jgi:hypothetical protein